MLSSPIKRSLAINDSHSSFLFHTFNFLICPKMKWIFLAVVTLMVVSSGCAQMCGGDEYQCNDGDCIPDYWECDGWYDCDGGEDETNCTCKPDDFICESGQCVPGNWYCDDYADCLDGSDERDCPCKEDWIRCEVSGHCIPPEYWCDADGIWDCYYGEDEMDCNRTVIAKPNNKAIPHSISSLEKENFILRSQLGKTNRIKGNRAH